MRPPNSAMNKKHRAQWSGEFRFGDSFAVYFGSAGHNELHRHAAYQLVVAEQGIASVVQEDGVAIRAKRLVIRPMVLHAIQSDHPFRLIYLDPQSPLALDLADRIDAGCVANLLEGALPFARDAEPAALVAELQSASRKPVSQLDSRLLDALDLLGERPGGLSISDAAQRCGLSDSRLRTLARQQLRVPISTWMIWRKLERAAQELTSGACLAEAALAGGFADQAHFTREMRRMFGITPRAAVATLKSGRENQ